MDQMKLQVGFATQDSSDPLTALKGKEMVSDVINGTNYSQIIPSKGGKIPFSDKFSNSTFGKNFGAWSAGLDIANTAFTGLFGEKGEYSGKKGDVTRTIDSTYDSIQNLAGNLGPIGQVVSLGMGANKLLGNVANKLGAGTDGMTTADAILGSSFLQLTPIGMINGLGRSKSDTITKDKQAFEQVGADYTGTDQVVDDALTEGGKYFGIFSKGDLRETNERIADANNQQKDVRYVAKNSANRRLLSQGMSAINGNRREYEMNGWNLWGTQVGRNGMKLDVMERAKNILSKYKEQQTNQLQQGGPIDPFEYYLESLPENQRDSTNFRVKDYWIFNGKPKDFKEALRRGMFTPDKKGFYHARSVSENPETGEIEYMKASNHPTRYMESDWYEKGLIYNENEDGTTSIIQLKPGINGYDDWVNFTNDYELVKSEPYWKYVRRQKKEVPSHKNGGTFIEISTETSIELVDPTSIPEFQNGGSINVIPDGALHARKHNMDLDGITRKGIPVVSEKDGEIEQQAEIEKEEIIFRLEVTQKLEELEKKFYSDESTQEEKDECALEAGKLLVNEILYNTQDNTNNLL